ncbi:MAG: heparan-alpha-glucosaminide N-acetyltransferase domain-containing protein [Clostridia bacterium]
MSDAEMTKQMNDNSVNEITLDVLKSKKRVWEIDFFRALCIFLVVLDHTLCDVLLVNGFSRFTSVVGIKILNFATWYWNCEWREVIQPFIVYCFIILSGISCSLSKSNLIRSVKMAVLAALITIVTYWISIILKLEMTIVFNVIHVLAICVLFWALIELIEKYIVKLPNWTLILLSVAIILVGEYFNWGYKAYEISGLESHLLYIPKNVNSLESFIFWNNQISTADFQPILPNLGYFLLGAVFGRTHYKTKKTLFPLVKTNHMKFICFCGRHTIWIYLGGQIIAFAAVAGLAFLIQ